MHYHSEEYEQGNIQVYTLERKQASVEAWPTRHQLRDDIKKETPGNRNEEEDKSYDR